jgi:hypothetical protein
VQSIAPLETGARAGRYRSPDTGAVVTDTPTNEPTTGPGFYVRPPGVPRAIKYPMAYLVRLVRPYDGKGQAGTGEHLEIPMDGASSPQGEQRPPREGAARGNTWRAKPAPWDAATFVVGEG